MPEARRVPELGEVQETLLIPLYARAVETRKRRGMLSDPRAVEMVEALDYDFARFDGAGSLIGSNLRTLLFDAWVRDFMERHPSGTVVEIGTGLNTRFERLDNGTVHWFDLDLPDVIALRRRFFGDTDRRRMLAASVTDPDWVATVAQSPGPYFLVAEAVLIYLDEQDVREVFDLVAGGLPGAHLALETASEYMVANQDRHDVLSLMAARLRWPCDDAREIEEWRDGIRLLESCTFLSLPEPVRRGLSRRYRLMLKAVGAVKRREMESYHFNLFRL